LRAGTLVGALYYLQLCYRIHKSAGMPPAKAVAYMRIGWVLRLILIVLVLGLAAYTEAFSFWAAVAGLFFLQLVIVINAVLLAGRERKAACGKRFKKFF
jgi:hypothetical protein